ncbi:RGS domain-containing protein [Calycina marina]|uniref:RGS domain-containing protein n=1 Tax=Calycina marina TaxID=1763456 RepID=A0A9P7YVU8_9HELO|nr:RGS domain-containing protein [Calycina marina]
MANPNSPAPVHQNRLPSLFETLSRRTLPPVDLFSFYIYMRDQQRSVDYLDFWLDVAQHMSLCRHYVRELRRSVMIGTPDGDKGQSKRSSALLESMGDMDRPAAGPSHLNTEKEKSQDAQMSAFLREQADNGNGLGHSPSVSLGSNNSGLRQTQSHELPRPSFMSTPLQASVSNSPNHSVSRADIRASAEKILYTFLLPQAEREIILPAQIVHQIITSIEEQGRDDPEVFDAAKDYVFQAMERDAFPGFLRIKALGNLVPPSMMMRLILGLLSLFAAFWVAFVLLFLDYPRSKRAFLAIPFTIGIYALATHQYALDPILALAGYSEYTFMSFSRIREPYVRKLLLKRAFTVLAVILAIDAALIALFVFVPGKRL